MSKGISLHVGLNTVDPQHYRDEHNNPWDGALPSCEEDAKVTLSIAKSQNFQSTLLLTKDATSENLSKHVMKATESLQDGDIFFFSYSGHGGQTWDMNHDEPANEKASLMIDEVVGKDETICLYDRQMLDDEINQLFSHFAVGVRVLVLSDSCHSGTMTRVVGSQGEELPVSKGCQIEATTATVKQNLSIYEEAWGQQEFRGARTRLKCSVLLLSGCLDTQQSRAGDPCSEFTRALLKVWNDGGFNGNYQDLHRQIVPEIDPSFDQTPSYFTDGVPNETFEQQKPFTI